MKNKTRKRNKKQEKQGKFVYFKNTTLNRFKIINE